MSTVTTANCACCGPQSGSGSGSGSGDGGSGSGGGRRYLTCDDCGRRPSPLTVTYLDQGGVTVTLAGGAGEYRGYAPSTPRLAGMFAGVDICTRTNQPWRFLGCESDTEIEMVSCNPMILYGATPFGTVVVTEDGSSPALPSLGSTAPGCDGISGTLTVDVAGGPACLTTSFGVVRVAPGAGVPCNRWAGGSSCGCEGGELVLTCAGGTWAASFNGTALTLIGQTASPFSVTFQAPADIFGCSETIPAGTAFVVTEP